MSPNKILITGARGFLGRELTRTMAARFPGAEIVAVGRRPAAGGEPSGPALDLRVAEAWRDLGERFDLVVHLAAAIPWKKDRQRDPETLHANIAMAQNLLAACHRWRPTGVVFASTISVYPEDFEGALSEKVVPRPRNCYAAAKLIGEYLLATLTEEKTRIVSLRLSSLYGPGQYPDSVLPLFLRQAMAGETLTLFGGGARAQDFVHVSDAAAAFVAAAESGRSGYYNIGSGIATTMRSLAEEILALPACRKGRIDLKDAADSGSSVRLDISKAREQLGFTPRMTLKEGLKHYCQSLLERPA